MITDDVAMQEAADAEQKGSMQLNKSSMHEGDDGQADTQDSFEADMTNNPRNTTNPNSDPDNEDEVNDATVSTSAQLESTIQTPGLIDHNDDSTIWQTRPNQTSPKQDSGLHHVTNIQLVHPVAPVNVATAKTRKAVIFSDSEDDAPPVGQGRLEATPAPAAAAAEAAESDEEMAPLPLPVRKRVGGMKARLGAGGDAAVRGGGSSDNHESDEEINTALRPQRRLKKVGSETTTRGGGGVSESGLNGGVVGSSSNHVTAKKQGSSSSLDNTTTDDGQRRASSNLFDAVSTATGPLPPNKKMSEFLKSIIGEEDDVDELIRRDEEEEREILAKYDNEKLFSDEEEEDAAQQDGGSKDQGTADGDGAATSTKKKNKNVDITEELIKLLPKELRELAERERGANNEEEQDENDEDVLYDSDGNVVPKSSQAADAVKLAMEIKKQRKASKKALLEMKMESERLLRTSYIELPERKSSLSMDNLLSKFGLARKKAKSAFGSREDQADEIKLEPQDGTASQSNQEQNSQEQSNEDSALPTIEANAKPAPQAPQKIPSLLQTRSSSTIAPHEVSLIHREQRAFLKSASNLDDDDDDIEIVDVAPKQTSQSSLDSRLSKIEQNLRLKRLAEEQAKIRRAEEAAEMAAKAEAKKRKREERKAQKKAEVAAAAAAASTGNGGNDMEGEPEDGFAELVARTVRRLELSSDEEDNCGGADDQNMEPNNDENGFLGVDVANQIKRPNSPRSPLKELEASQSLDSTNTPPTPSSSDGEGDENEQTYDVDEDGFAVTSTIAVELQSEIMSTQELFSNNAASLGSLSTTTQTNQTVKKLSLMKSKSGLTQTQKPLPPPKKGGLLYFFQKSAQKQQGNEAVAATQEVDIDFGMLSGRFESQDGANDNDDDVDMENEEVAQSGSGDGTDNDVDDDNDDSGGSDNDEENGSEDRRESDSDAESKLENGSGEEEPETGSQNAQYAGSTSQTTEKDALHHLMKMMKRKLKKMKKKELMKMGGALLDTEAAEEEDEFMGMGGPDGDVDEDSDSSLVCSGDEDQIEDFTDVVELHRQQLLEADSKAVETLLNDVTAGGLRKRMMKNAAAKGFDLSDTDDEEEILKAIKRRQASMAAPTLGGDDDDADRPMMERYALNPKTAAFARCFSSVHDDESDTLEEEQPVTMATIKATLVRQGSGLGLRKKGSFHHKKSARLGSLTESVTVEDEYQDDDVDDDGDDDDLEFFDSKPKKKSKFTIEEDSEDEAPTRRKAASQAKSKTSMSCHDDDEEDFLSEIGKVDVMSLIRDRKPAQVTKRDENDVGSMKYTSRITATTNVFRATTYINTTSNMAKSPTSLSKLKSKVLAINGGAPLSRSFAGGLEANVTTLMGQTKSKGGSIGFAVGGASNKIVKPNSTNNKDQKSGGKKATPQPLLKPDTKTFKRQSALIGLLSKADSFST